MGRGSNWCLHRDKAGSLTHCTTRNSPGLYSLSEILALSLFFFFFGHAQGMQKFPGQGSKLSHSSDNMRSLTCCVTKELPLFLFETPQLLQSTSCLPLFSRTCWLFFHNTHHTFRSLFKAVLLVLFFIIPCLCLASSTLFIPCFSSTEILLTCHFLREKRQICLTPRKQCPRLVAGQ